MKNISFLSLSIAFTFMMVMMPLAIGSEQIELQSIEQKTALSIMDITRYDLIDGKIDADEAIKIIKDLMQHYFSVTHPARKVISSDEAQDRARQMIVLLTEQRDMCISEYILARAYLPIEKKAQLDDRYNAFTTEMDELIHEQKIITGQTMSTLKKIVVGAAAVGVVLLLGRYMFSMNPVEQTVSQIDAAQAVSEIAQIPQTDTAPIASSTDAEIERDALIKQIIDAKAQLEKAKAEFEAEQESNAVRSAGQKMIDQKREERRIEKDIEDMEWQYKENIVREQRGRRLTEQERKQLHKQAWFDVAASYTLTGISLLLGLDMPLVGGSILVPLQPFGYMAHPVAVLARTAAVTGAMGVYRFIQSLPEDRPVPRIFEHINPH